VEGMLVPHQASDILKILGTQLIPMASQANLVLNCSMLSFLLDVIMVLKNHHLQ